MDYFEYIVRSKSTKKFYTGMTTDLERRLKQHNGHLSNTLTTKNLTDFELVYCQITEDRKEARTLEKFLKSGFGREIRDELVEFP